MESVNLIPGKAGYPKLPRDLGYARASRKVSVALLWGEMAALSGPIYWGFPRPVHWSMEQPYHIREAYPGNANKWITSVWLALHVPERHAINIRSSIRWRPFA